MPPLSYYYPVGIHRKSPLSPFIFSFSILYTTRRLAFLYTSAVLNIFRHSENSSRGIGSKSANLPFSMVAIGNTETCTLSFPRMCQWT